MKLTHLTALTAALALAACSGGNDTTDPETPEAINGEVEFSDGTSDESGGEGGNGDEAMTNEDYAAARDRILGRDTMEEGREDPEFTAACLSASNMNEDMCRCISRHSTANLTDRSRDFLLATLTENTQEAARLRGEMTMQEASQAGMFMVNSATTCAAEGHNQ
ncbi:hypothetical protein [Hyphobacterium marinum]|uniref:Lipoprotein n=1 Tax=Hyphobacterium marinum TaxID=3116574 RepID=A0ABU7LWP5_9PROT|nr:hypothetical protein [Hyphobacterium sp. Y6023]MEE2565978.1 hypothetical protein [Hyphobacterium sp. Y6023]